MKPVLLKFIKINENQFDLTDDRVLFEILFLLFIQQDDDADLALENPSSLDFAQPVNLDQLTHSCPVDPMETEDSINQTNNFQPLISNIYSLSENVMH